jgi:hypothetical protein
MEAALLIGITFACAVALYRFAIRPLGLTRFLFGFKSMRGQKSPWSSKNI